MANLPGPKFSWKRVSLQINVSHINNWRFSDLRHNSGIFGNTVICSPVLRDNYWTEIVNQYNLYFLLVVPSVCNCWPLARRWSGPLSKIHLRNILSCYAQLYKLLFIYRISFTIFFDCKMIFFEHLNHQKKPGCSLTLSSSAFEKGRKVRGGALSAPVRKSIKELTETPCCYLEFGTL